MKAWLERLVTEEASTRSLGLMRLLFGLILWSRFARELMPYRHFDEPDRVVLSAVFYVATTGMVLGLFTPVSMVLTSATLIVMSWGYGGTASDPTAWVHHHTTMHLLCVIWLSLTPCGKSLSVDRWLAVRRAEQAGQPPPAEVAPTWGRHLIGAQVATLYLWSAVDKLQCNYWNGAAIEHLVMRYYVGAALPDVWWFHAACAAAGVITVVLELVLFWGLFVPRLQPVLVPLGLVLHILFYVLIPVNTFTVWMMTCYLAFVHPDVVHRAIDRMLGRGLPQAA